MLYLLLEAQSTASRCYGRDNTEEVPNAEADGEVSQSVNIDNDCISSITYLVLLYIARRYPA